MTDALLNWTIRAAAVKEREQIHDVAATPAQCQAIATAFGLEGLRSLEGRFTLNHERSGMIAAQLRLRAELTQICVVTLEPFEARIQEEVPLRFVPASQLGESEGEELDVETLEAPDEIPYMGDTIDLGAALTEQLALSLDPYPRKPGSVLHEVAPEATEHPFAALARRRDAGKDGE